MNSTAINDRALLAFLNLMAQFRDEDDIIYDSIAPGYDRFADHWDRTFARSALDALFQRIVERLPVQPKILDAGCGTGRHLDEFRQHLAPGELIGIDKSRRMLELARRRCTPGKLALVHGNVHSLPFPDASFDAVVAVWVLETLSDPRGAVQEFLRVIKPGGVVGYTFVQIPADHTAASLNTIQELTRAGPHLPAALSSDRMPFHECDKSTLEHFCDGLVSVVTLGKCCVVDDRLLPTNARTTRLA